MTRKHLVIGNPGINEIKNAIHWNIITRDFFVLENKALLEALNRGKDYTVYLIFVKDNKQLVDYVILNQKD